MNAPLSAPDFRTVPLSRLVPAPENVRATPPSAADQAELAASIEAHGLLGNLVIRPDPADDGAERFAVIAGGRRLAAMQTLAEDGRLDRSHPVPCQVVGDDNAAELSLAENTVRIPMHAADQVHAFRRLVDGGASVAAVAARFGASERLVEQRLRLAGVAPAIMDAYRADEISLSHLQAFAVTTDQGRQLAAWDELRTLPYRFTSYQVKRKLTEDPVPGHAAVARFVGLEAYENAGGEVMRDLFSDENDVELWLNDPALLDRLAMDRLGAASDELATRWKWAEPRLEVDWAGANSFGRVHPSRAADPTQEERDERRRLDARHEELDGIPDADWTDDHADEAGTIVEGLERIERRIAARAGYRAEDMAIAGCIVTIGDNGDMEVIRGLVRREDMPGTPASGGAASASGGADAASASGDPAPAVDDPAARPLDPAAEARRNAGLGIGLADDLRALRNTIVKVRLSRNFDAAFDLLLFQLCRSAFRTWSPGRALDITVSPTGNRPAARHVHEPFARWNAGEAILDDISRLPLEWMSMTDDGDSFAAMRALDPDAKRTLFSAAIASTVTGQLAFEHDARPELEATIAGLDIDFAAEIRPAGDMFWSRITKDRLLGIARTTLGDPWAVAHGKFRKADLAVAMEAAFAAGDAPVGVGPAGRQAALAWTMPGFAAFDAGSVPDPASRDGISPTAGAHTPPTAAAAPATGPARNGRIHDAPMPDGVTAAAADIDDDLDEDLPEFLRNA